MRRLRGVRLLRAESEQPVGEVGYLVHLPEEALDLREERRIAIVRRDRLDVVSGGGARHEQLHHLGSEHTLVSREHRFSEGRVRQPETRQGDREVVEPPLVEEGQGTFLEHAANGAHLLPHSLSFGEHSLLLGPHKVLCDHRLDRRACRRAHLLYPYAERAVHGRVHETIGHAHPKQASPLHAHLRRVRVRRVH